MGAWGCLNNVCMLTRAGSVYVCRASAGVTEVHKFSKLQECKSAESAKVQKVQK
jgi:hypothetical protein